MGAPDETGAAANIDMMVFKPQRLHHWDALNIIEFSVSQHHVLALSVDGKVIILCHPCVTVKKKKIIYYVFLSIYSFSTFFFSHNVFHLFHSFFIVLSL